MAEHVYRIREHCAGCKIPINSKTAFLSAHGPLCNACHALEKHRAREHNLGRESEIEALLAGIVGFASGAALTAFGVLTDGTIPVRLVAGCILATIVCTWRAYRFTARPRGMRSLVGRALVTIGAALGVLGLIVLFARFAE